MAALRAAPPAAVAEIRARAVAALSSALGGDGLAAEYTLLALLARVHTRAEPLALGKVR